VFKHFVITAVVFTLSAGVQGCAKIHTPSQNLVIREDHAGLVTYYDEQAQELRKEAKVWDRLADLYERQAEIHGKQEPKQYAVHCRAVAASYRKAADEVNVLATEHRLHLPHGVME
jgi:hypothetical protein